MGAMTILYYTAGIIPEYFAERIRENLLSFDLPIISITYTPLDFGTNIVVGEKDGLDSGRSRPNVYRKILIGARHAKTRYIACCEDDALYPRSHFDIIPKKRGFYYNRNRWVVLKDCYLWRKSILMSTCIAHTDMMIDNLEKRFSLPWAERYMSEPGKHEHKTGNPRVSMHTGNSRVPVLVFDHKYNINGQRGLNKNDITTETLQPYGRAEDVWQKYWENNR